MVTPPIKMIPLSEIDPPENAMRIEIPDDYIERLAESISKQGLINPLSVKQVNGRFRIRAGHCRYLACKYLHLDEVACRDYTGVPIKDEAIKAHENLYRLDPNPAEIASWLQDLIDEESYDLAKLMDVTGKSEDWISRHLSLMRGNQEIFHFVRTGQLTLAQAVELNKFPTDFQRSYTDAAVKSGAPGRLIQDWRKQLVLEQMPQVEPSATDNAPVIQSTPQMPQMPCCALCNSNQQFWNMVDVKVHRSCIEDITNAIQSAGIKQ